MRQNRFGLFSRSFAGASGYLLFFYEPASQLRIVLSEEGEAMNRPQGGPRLSNQMLSGQFVYNAGRYFPQQLI